MIDLNNTPQAALARKIHFSCGHRYYNPRFSDEENKKIFGSCYSPYGHGHNYTLEAHFRGPIQTETGMVINLAEVDLILKDVTNELDHKHLNFDVPYFKDHIPTTEMIAQYLYQKIADRVALPVQLFKVRLYENDDLWVDYSLSNDIAL